MPAASTPSARTRWSRAVRARSVWAALLAGGWACGVCAAEGPRKPALEWVRELRGQMRELNKRPAKWAAEGEPIWLCNDQLKDAPGWKNHHDLPVWAQRGKVNFSRHVRAWYNPKQWPRCKRALADGITHWHGCEGGYSQKLYPPEFLAWMKENQLPVGMRAEAVMFFGFDDNARMAGTPAAYHSYPHNVNWFLKFPELMMGTAYDREGHTLSEYLGSDWVERYLGAIPSPHFRKFRELYLRGFVQDKPVFEGEDCPGMYARIDKIWLDNPTTTVASWDPYTVAAAQKQFRAWFGRPVYDPVANPDPLIRRAWRHYAARTISEYYRWNKALLNRLAGRQVLQSANTHTQKAQCTYDMWLVNQGGLDFMDSEEGGPRGFAGHKMGIAASNGRTVLRHFGGFMAKAESMACLASSSSNGCAVLNHFLLRNQEIYGNAQPGSNVAVLFHIRRSLESDQLNKIILIAGQLQRQGMPFEVVVEDDLTEAGLSIYDALLLPGLPVMPREIEVLKAFCQRGGTLVLLGDNRADFTDTPLTAALGGPTEWKAAAFPCGRGRVVNFEPQFVDDAVLAEPLRSRARAFLKKPDDDVFLNLTYQPVTDARFAHKSYGPKDLAYPHFDFKPLRDDLLALHLVNYAGKPKQKVRIAIAAATAKRLPFAAVLRPGAAEPAELSRTEAGVVFNVAHLGPYAVAVLCADKADRDRLVAEERAAPRPATRDAAKLASWKPLGGAGRPWVVEGDGARACLLAIAGESPRRGFLARFRYPVRAEAGRPFRVHLDQIRRHIWGLNTRVYDAQLRFRRLGDGKEVTVAVAALEGKLLRELKKAAFDIPVTLPGPGHWQAGWHIRIVHEMFDGKVGPSRMRQKYTLDGEPRFAIPYNERLERFVVQVPGAHPGRPAEPGP